ncbi:uncharacterized protein LOC102703992 isoform X2 [Oryza brachyantha]|uniref:uncharacterized protein LOC102703992 isoform X2 n=1 Tax=Oryza brachyantha TaxID=4533 RepID=UPI001ADAAE6F|nr:uncharacterized protein LOC102703992 isoform X2 [Oryza brachyantha]
MATVLRQANRAEEAIEAIRSFRDRCPNEAQESLDNILLDLYKKCGRTKEQIEMLTMRLRIVDEELASGRWKTKLSKSHGRVVYLSLRDEKARLLGNLAWAHMQSENYDEAEMLYRQALAIEADYNKECNLAICLIKTGKMKREEPQNMIATSGEKNKKCLDEYQDLSRLFNDAATPQSLLEKLRKRLVKEDTPNISTQHQAQIPSYTECLPKSNGVKDAIENPMQEGKAPVSVGKRWADMVEEDEHQLDDVRSTIGMDTTEQNVSSKHANEKMYRTPSSSQESSTFQMSSVGDHLQSSSAGSWRCNVSKISTDENVNLKFARTAPSWRQHKVEDYSNRVSQRLDTVHLSEKAQGTEQPPWRSSTAQRSLFPEWKSKCERCERYGHGYVPFGDSEHFQGSSHFEATHRWPKNATDARPWRPQNRLRVFQEITNGINQKVV